MQIYLPMASLPFSHWVTDEQEIHSVSPVHSALKIQIKKFGKTFLFDIQLIVWLIFQTFIQR